MTKEEARIVLLEEALRQAQHTVEFLHNCLVNPYDPNKTGGCMGYSYGFPDQTIKHLKEWSELVPLGQPCFHSGLELDCLSCVERHRAFLLSYIAKKVLGIEVKRED